MLPIKNILDSLRDDVLSGKITLHEAAEELHESGWTNFIDEDAACRLLKLCPKTQNHQTEVHKMSCFIMSDQAHATTANTLEYILNSGFNRFGFDAPDSLYKALSDCRDRYGFYCSGLIFRRLYDLNSRAYAGRYKTDADTTPPEMPSVPPLVQEREREDQHEKLLPWHYKLAKLIDCEIYQASEDATRKDPLLLALIDFSRVYTHFLVSNTADYNAAPWGTI